MEKKGKSEKTKKKKKKKKKKKLVQLFAKAKKIHIRFICEKSD